jgi:2-polyprenyl-3-methyl-5-hydroxy-6-metoxy-1,4-benzoquinol methylase
MTTATELAVACTICRVDDAEPLYRPRLSPGPVVRCRRCGLVYVSPVEHVERLAGASVDAAAGRILDAAESPAYHALYLAESEVKARVYRETLDRLAVAVDPPGMLLDVGSYMGLFLKSAIARGWRGRGIEPDRDAWRHATSTLGLDVCWGTLETCPQPKGGFDAVTMLQVLEHVPDPRQTLADVRGLLRPGGALIVEVPNIDCWPVRLLRRRHRHFAKHHFTFFGPRTLCQLIEDCGFEVVSVGYPARHISMRLLAWGLESWHPGLAGVAAPVLRARAFRDRVLRLNLGEVLSVCARTTARGAP